MNAEQHADVLEDLEVVVEEVPEELGETETDDQEGEQQNPDPELFQTQDFEESCYGPSCKILFKWLVSTMNANV